MAEALQIVPGVAITRPRGEGQYVSIRGLGPQFQNTVLNGRQIAINEFVENGNALGTQFRFEMLPSEFTSQIEVVKSPTANMTEGALGGNINVHTLRPFEVGNSTTLGVRGTLTSLTGKVTPTLTGITSGVSSDGTLGLLVGGQYLRKDVRNDHLWNFGWNQNVALFRGTLGPGIYTPTRTRPTFEHEERERLSGLVSAQWRPSPELETTLDLLATRLNVQYDEIGDGHLSRRYQPHPAGGQSVGQPQPAAARIRPGHGKDRRRYGRRRHDRQRPVHGGARTGV